MRAFESFHAPARLLTAASHVREARLQARIAIGQTEVQREKACSV